jgi:hypothetical protein
MPKNPYLHAFAAALYIVVLVLVMGTFVDGPHEGTLLVPMTMISLFVLSAATMGYLFLSQPIMLYLDGSKKEAATFFLQTLATFAGICLAFLLGVVIIGG